MVLKRNRGWRGAHRQEQRPQGSWAEGAAEQSPEGGQAWRGVRVRAQVRAAGTRGPGGVEHWAGTGSRG